MNQNHLAKSLASMALCLTLLAAAIPGFALEAGDTMWVANCSEYVSLREAASSSSKQLAKVNLADAVTYAGEASNGFSKVSYVSQTGYILTKYLSSSEPDPSDFWDRYLSEGDALFVVLCNDYVSLRNAPRTSAARLAKVPLYARVEYIERVSNGFTKVEYQGQTGYILTKNLDMYEPNTAADADWDWTPSDGDPMWIIKCNNYVSLRAAASSSSSQIARIPLGSRVTYIESIAGGYTVDGFVKIEYEGQTGYVKSEYLDQYEPQG